MKLVCYILRRLRRHLGLHAGSKLALLCERRFSVSCTPGTSIATACMPSPFPGCSRPAATSLLLAHYKPQLSDCNLLLFPNKSNLICYVLECEYNSTTVQYSVSHQRMLLNRDQLSIKLDRDGSPVYRKNS